MNIHKSHKRLHRRGIHCVTGGHICAVWRVVILSLVVFAWTFLTDPAPLEASTASPTEDQIKAAIVFNILKFVDWPEESFATGNAPITISVLGKGEFGTALEALQGKTIRGRLVIVRQVSRIDEKTPCQILVIVKSERRRLQDVLRQLNHQSVLTISDAPRFASAGGIIGFIELDGRVGFEINQETARRCRIRISSHLLKLAHIVRDGE